MKALLLFTVAAGLAAYVGNVASAPIGVVVVTTEGHRFVMPVPGDDIDPKDIDLFRLTPEFVHPHPEIPEGDVFPWMTPGIQVPPPDADLKIVKVDAMDDPVPGDHPHPHPHPQPPRVRKGGCVLRKGKPKSFKKMLAHRMHRLMNKLRAALGLPIVEHHHRHGHQHNHDGENTRYRLRPTEGVMEETDKPSDESQSFFTRFEHAMRSLSPWESRAVTFVLGLGLGSLLRMFIVLGIVLIRGRRACRAGRRCGRRGFCRRRFAQDDAETNAVTAALAPVGFAPPAYTRNEAIDEKPRVVDATPAMDVPPPTIVLFEVPEMCKEVVTVEQNDSGILEVYWLTTDGEERRTPATEFHKMYPQALIDFYESNLKWKPVEEETTEAK